MHFQAADEWRIVFYITSAIYCVGCIIYWFWASGEVQPWAQIPTDAPKFNAQTIENGNGTTTKNGYVNEAIELKE